MVKFKASLDIDFKGIFKDFEEDTEQKLINITKEVLKYIRDNYKANFIGVTHRLENSLGAQIYKDNELIYSDFGEDEGAVIGEKYATLLSNEDHKSGYKIFVVAGMDYAQELESKGRDVITSAKFVLSDLIKANF